MGNESAVSDEENQAGDSDPKQDNINASVEEEKKEELEEKDFGGDKEEGQEEAAAPAAKKENKYPPYFYDPDTNDLMVDPVVHPCGKSFEKSTLAAGVQEYCYPNRALQSCIEAELERRQLEGTILGKMKQWDGSLRDGLKQIIDKSALPSREYRPLPDYYYCPITYELIEEPVIDSDGYTYEYDAIVQWIRNNGTSPVTRKPLQIDKLYDNLALEQILRAESNKVNEDSIHPSIRRWKQQLANKQHRSIRDHVEEQTTDNNNNNNNNNDNNTTQQNGRQFPTNPEDLDERRRRYKSCACKTVTFLGCVLVLLVLVLAIPAVGGDLLLFVLIFLSECVLECCCSICSNSNDDDDNNDNDNNNNINIERINGEYQV